LIGFFVIPALQAQSNETNFLAVRQVVQNQLTAFATDDAVLAFSYAAPVLRDIFKTPENFMAMVQKSNAVVYRPTNILFFNPKVFKFCGGISCEVVGSGG